MAKNITIGFMLAILVLIVSEYFFLQELHEQKRAWMLVIAGAGIVTGFALFLFCYKRYRNSSR